MHRRPNSMFPEGGTYVTDVWFKCTDGAVTCGPTKEDAGHPPGVSSRDPQEELASLLSDSTKNAR